MKKIFHDFEIISKSDASNKRTKFYGMTCEAYKKAVRVSEIYS